MAFQGFARQDEFSTGQIKIDIDRVISSDLKEAGRMSKYMASNAAFSEKYGSMYLNALVNKHSVEKRDREENFASFMKNREAIQEQVKYNWEVKAKDARKPDPYIPSFWEMVQPAMMKMLVEVGGAAIKKAIGDFKANKAEAAAQEESAVRSHAERYYAEASQEQKELQDSGFMKDYADANAARQLEMRTHYNSLGQHQLGEISAAYQNKMSGMEAVEHRAARFSLPNLTIGYKNHLQNFEWDTGNGNTVTAADIEALPHNDATVNGFLEAARQSYMEDSGLLNEGGPVNKNTFVKAYQHIEGPYRHAIHNQRVRQSKRDNEASFYQRIEDANQTGGAKGILDITFNKDNVQSIAAQMGNEYAVGFFKRSIENGAYDTERLNELYDIPFGPGGVSINEDIRKNTARGREYAALRAKQVDREQAQHANQQAEQDLAVNDMIAQFRTYDPNNQEQAQEARALLESSAVPRSDINKFFGTLRKGQASELTAVLSQAAGVVPKVDVASAAWDLQDKLISDGDVSAGVEATVLDNLIETKQTQNTWKKANLYKAKLAYRNWLTDVIANYGSNDPREVMNHIGSILNNDNSDDYKRLKKMLTINTLDDQGHPLQTPVFSYIEKHGTGAMPRATGVSQYQALVNESYGPPSDLEKIYQTPEIKEGMIPLLNKLKNAKKRGYNLQHVLSNHGTPFIKARLKHGGNTVGTIVNEAIENGNYGGKYEKLSGDVIIDRNEMEQIEASIPRYSQMSPALQGRLLGQQLSGQGFTPNANNVISTSGYRGSTNVTNTGFKDYKDRDIMLSPQATVSWNAMIDAGMPFNSKSVHSVYRDEAEVKRLWSQGIDASATGAHNRGEAMDVHGDMGAWIKKHGKEFGWGPEDNSYGHGGHGGHFIFKGYNPPQQQTQLPPISVNTETLPSNAVLAPWTPEGNTPTQQTQAAKNNEIMQEWLSKVEGMWLPPLLRGGYGND